MVDGGYAYKCLFMAQSRSVEEFFRILFDEIQPTTVVEIGTFHGGLTLLMRDILDELLLSSTSIITYDINNQEFLKPLVINRNVSIRTHNLFSDDYTSFRNQDTEQEIKNILSIDRCLVLCDGGCKKCEFNLISPLLKQNDIIMAHDYAPNESIFNRDIKDRVWDWMEIEDNDINDSCTKFNLIPFKQELAQQSAWLCRIKV